jgi:hypothetical protein
LTMSGYTKYVSESFVVNPHDQATKHYYIAGERIASRLAGPARLYEIASPVLDTDDQIHFSRIQSAHIQELNAFALANNMSYFFLPPAMEECNRIPEQISADQCYCAQSGGLLCDEILFYYHSDQVSSTNLITDYHGLQYQFLLFLPFGETMIEQKAAAWGTPYTFNSKEQDAMTGLYDYGFRLYLSRP